MEATLLEKWIQKEEKVASLSKRKYLHFDRYIDFKKNQKKIIIQLSSKYKIATHAFYPFISAIVETPRYKLSINSDGKKERKSESKNRPIAYASHFDALVYSWYSTILTHKYETQLLNWGIKDCVLAYLETGKSNIDYSLDIFAHVKNQNKCAAIAIDISGFFNNLDHALLKSMWEKTLDVERLHDDHFNVFSSLTKFSIVPKDVLNNVFAFNLPSDRYCSPEQFRNNLRKGKLIEKNPNKNILVNSKRYNQQCGIPQGSPISAVLSNIYMIDFDISMSKLAADNNAVYKRYCDDIIVVCKLDEVNFFLNQLSSLAEKNELSINADKTEITYFSKKDNLMRGYKEATFTNFKNLQYLGFEFNGQNIYIRGSSISRYKRRLATEIRECLKAANGKNSLSPTVFKKKLLTRFSSKGKRNFITYAARAANKVMKSKTIRKQYNRSIDNVLNTFKIKQKKYNQKITQKDRIPKANS